MIDKAKIKACVFDAYGTLLDVHAPSMKLADKIGPDATSVSNLWRLKQLEYTWLRSLMGTYAGFWDVTQHALDYTLEQHGINNSDLRQALLDMYFSLDAYGDAQESLRRLKDAGMMTAILSNGSPDMLEAAVNSSKLGAGLDRILSADEVKIYKPDFRVYDLVGTYFQTKPEEVCFVSSNGWDAAGAAEYGFQVAWINRLDAPIENLPGKPASLVGSLTEVADLVLL